MRSPCAALVIGLALKHINNGAAMMSSAQLCLSDANASSDDKVAAMRAVESLKYSVGILHPDYQRAVKLAGEA